MLIEPVEMASMGAIELRWPRRMIEPLPNCFSICPTAMSMAFVRSLRSSNDMRSPLLRLSNVAEDYRLRYGLRRPSRGRGTILHRGLSCPARSRELEEAE